VAWPTAKGIAMKKATLIQCLFGLLIVAGLAYAGYTTGVYQDQGGDRLVVTSSGSLENYQGAGTIAAHALVTTTGLTLAEYGDTAVHKTVWTFDDVAMFINDSGANGGHGSIKLYEGPAGIIKVIGASVSLEVVCDSNGLADAATYDFGVGTTTTGTDNAALATTEQNIIAKIEGDLNATGTNNATLGASNATAVDLDGHTTSVDYFFNAAIEADDASADDYCTVNGTITIVWVNFGDY